MYLFSWSMHLSPFAVEWNAKTITEEAEVTRQKQCVLCNHGGNTSDTGNQVFALLDTVKKTKNNGRGNGYLCMYSLLMLTSWRICSLHIVKKYIKFHSFFWLIIRPVWMKHRNVVCDNFTIKNFILINNKTTLSSGGIQFTLRDGIPPRLSIIRLARHSSSNSRLAQMLETHMKLMDK